MLSLGNYPIPYMNEKSVFDFDLHFYHFVENNIVLECPFEREVLYSKYRTVQYFNNLQARHWR